MTTSPWRPTGLALHERWSTEVTCEAGPVRAVVRVSRLRVGVDFSMVSPADTAHLALAAAHRLAAAAPEQVVAAEGWFVADPTVYVRRANPGVARVVITGCGAAQVAEAFFGPAVAAVLRRRQRPRQLALGTGG